MVNLVCEGCGHEWASRVPNPQKCPNCQRQRRKQLPSLLRFQTFNRDGFKCQDCDFEAQDGEGLHAHHLIPRSQSGPDELDNLLTLCVGCHWRRHAFNGNKKGYQSKTYSLSDEVVEAIEAAKAGGETPNRYLLRLVQMERVATATGSYLKDVTGPDVKELQYERDDG